MSKPKNGISPAMYRFAMFFLVVLILVLGLLGLQVERRNDSIEQLHEATTRVEMAALHTEEVLIELLEARRSPEAIERADDVTDALRQIDLILDLLCHIDDPVRADACTGLGLEP